MRKTALVAAVMLLGADYPAVADTPCVWNCEVASLNTKPVKGSAHHRLVRTAQGYAGQRWGGRKWCQRFANHVLKEAGYHPTGSDLSRSILSLPRTAPQPGALAWWPNHTSIVVAVDGNRVHLISGNWGGRVAYHSAPISKVRAFVQPRS